MGSSPMARNPKDPSEHLINKWRGFLIVQAQETHSQNIVQFCGYCLGLLRIRVLRALDHLTKTWFQERRIRRGVQGPVPKKPKQPSNKSALSCYEKGVLHGSLFASKLVKNLGAQEKPKHTTNNKTQSKAFAQMFVCEKGWVRITPPSIMYQ